MVFQQSRYTVEAIAVRYYARNRAGGATCLVVRLFYACLAQLGALRVELHRMVVIVDVAHSIERAINPTAGLRIGSINGELIYIVYASPVKCGCAVRTPLAFWCIVRRMLVVTGVLVFMRVVEARSNPYIAFLGDYLGDERVSFMRDAIVCCRVYDITVRFLIVRHVVLRANDRSVLLCSLCVEGGRAPYRVEVFTRVFGVAPVRQYAVSVRAQSRRGNFVAVTNFFSSAFSMRRERYQVPNDDRADWDQGDRAEVVNPTDLVPFVPRRFKACAIESIYRPGLQGARAHRAQKARF